MANQKDLGAYYIGTPGTQNRETTMEGSSINSSKWRVCQDKGRFNLKVKITNST